MAKSRFFGLKCCESLANYDQDSQSLRTFQTSFEWVEPECLRTLPLSGMIQNGRLSRLKCSDSPISDDDGSVLLPTPTEHLHKETGSLNDYTKTDKKTITLLGRLQEYEPDPKKRNRLNPQFVEYMMGFPIDYTTTD